MDSRSHENNSLSRESDETLSVEHSGDVGYEVEKMGLLSSLRNGPYIPLWNRAGTAQTSLKWRVLQAFGVLAIAVLSFLAGYELEGPNRHKTREWYEAALAPDEIRPYIQSPASEPYINEYAARFMINASDPDTPFYRKEPSPEVDRAWYYASRDRLFLLNREDMLRQGKNPEEHVKIPEEWGYGADKYPVRLWHLHRMHCLDSLRRMLYPDYYNMTAGTDVRHASHCIATLYEYLKCHPSWDIMHYVWIQDVPKPWADWRQVEVCQSMQPMLDFDERHDKDLPGQVEADKRIRFMMPPEEGYKFPMTPSTMAYIVAGREEHPNWPDLKTHTEMRQKLLDETLKEWKETGEVPRWDISYGWF